MVRVIGLTLVLAMGAATVAQAENRLERPAGKAIGTVLHHKAGHGPASRLQLQIGSAVVFVPAGRELERRADLLEVPGSAPVLGGEERSRTAYGHAEDGLNFGASSQPGLAYSVNDAFSLGLDYRYQSGETMSFKVARVGGLEPDYHSHNFLLEARLEF
jgi:hypothetical protein